MPDADSASEAKTFYTHIPVVMAGGKKLPELDALTMAYQAVQEGAAGVDMGRNIFQSDCPIGMLQAVSKIVHEGMAPAEAFDLYTMIKHTQAEAEPQPMN
jgi:3-hydroxy-5-phosphonooxypentane-2,4-dione thiolase